jgi:V/A-type H+-transporting ATPase subunit I
MIVPMKKATILFETGDAEATVKNLRTLGVLHIEHQNVPDGRDISRLQENVTIIHSSLDILNREIVLEKNIQPQKKISGDWMAIVNHIIELDRYQEELQSSSGLITDQIKEWERWGDIDPDQIEHLSQNGIYLTLYRVPVKDTGIFPGDVIVKTIFTSGNSAYCVAISRRQFECAYEEILPPKKSLSVLQSQLAENYMDLAHTKREIVCAASFSDDLIETVKKIEKEIELQQVINGMGKVGAICYITGYIPSDRVKHLVAEAGSRKWGIMIADPSVEDIVPTLLKNPKWVSMIYPVFELLGLTPGYRELDISMLFLIFFSIFFGILIGDAGYGMVYILLTLLITIWSHKTMKWNTEIKTMVSLFYLLGFCAILWGFLTGTFFGQGWLRPLVPQLNDANTMQTFCFFLGALQLSIAHSWRAVLKFPSPTALADAGYICILWTAFFLARTLVLGEPFPSYGTWLVGTGIVLVILCTHPQVRVLRGIGEGVGTLVLSFMNNITDVISYVRLFAVGLAGIAISETTNTLASGFGNSVAGLLAGVVILIVGHSLNMILGIISVLVHGVRLNVLEFSGHANVTWSGSGFKPLKE